MVTADRRFTVRAQNNPHMIVVIQMHTFKLKEEIACGLH